MSKEDLKAAMFAGWMVVVLVSIVVAIYLVLSK